MDMNAVFLGRITERLRSKLSRSGGINYGIFSEKFAKLVWLSLEFSGFYWYLPSILPKLDWLNFELLWMFYYIKLPKLDWLNFEF